MQSAPWPNQEVIKFVLIEYFCIFSEDPNTAIYNPKVELQIAAGYYNSAINTGENDNSSFMTNGFSSFIGSDVSFNLEVSTKINNDKNKKKKKLKYVFIVSEFKFLHFFKLPIFPASSTRNEELHTAT